MLHGPFVSKILFWIFFTWISYKYKLNSITRASYAHGHNCDWYTHATNIYGIVFVCVCSAWLVMNMFWQQPNENSWIIARIQISFAPLDNPTECLMVVCSRLCHKHQKKSFCNFVDLVQREFFVVLILRPAAWAENTKKNRVYNIEQSLSMISCEQTLWMRI